MADISTEQYHAGIIGHAHLGLEAIALALGRDTGVDALTDGLGAGADLFTVGTGLAIAVVIVVFEPVALIGSEAGFGIHAFTGNWAHLIGDADEDRLTDELFTVAVVRTAGLGTWRPNFVGVAAVHGITTLARLNVVTLDAGRIMADATLGNRTTTFAALSIRRTVAGRRRRLGIFTVTLSIGRTVALGRIPLTT